MKQRHAKKFDCQAKEKFEAYLLNHAHGLFSSLGRLSRSPFSSTMTILVLAIAISLAGGFYILIANIQQLPAICNPATRCRCFCMITLPRAPVQKLAEHLKQNPRVEEVKFITKKQAMEEFKA